MGGILGLKRFFNLARALLCNRNKVFSLGKIHMYLAYFDKNFKNEKEDLLT